MPKCRLAVVLVLALVVALALPSIASAHTAYRYMSDGTSGDSTTIDGDSAALAWIQTDPHAKGNYRDHSNYVLWVVLRDLKISHHNTSTNRPGPYYNEADPYYYTRAIQYTLNLMGYSMTVDNVFGPTTQSKVKSFQANNSLTSDGIVGTGTYYRLSWDSY